ncbi:MAG: hypothetical protein QM755_02670 [Luteolibacter sp.]
MKPILFAILPIALVASAQEAASPAAKETPKPSSPANAKRAKQAAAQAGDAPSVTVVPPALFQVPEGLEVTVWATTPQLHNPTNIDIDKDGRIWVAEGVDYRKHTTRQPAGDRIMVLEDTDGDGKADKSDVFAQQDDLLAPLGVAVLDNKVIVSMAPDLLVYTDVNGDRKFDPATDKREVLLTGFNGRNHDHSLHSLTAGPRWPLVFQPGQYRCGFHRSLGEDLPHGRQVRGEERRWPRVGGRLHRADESGWHQCPDHRPQLPQFL